MVDRLDLTKEQVRAFESPVRASVLGLLRSRGTMTAREVAEALRLKPDRLYYHLRALMRLGLVLVSEVRPADTKPETVYGLAAKEFYVTNLARDPEYAWSVLKSAANVQRLALSHYERALQADFDDAALRFGFANGRMTPDEIKKLKDDLLELGRRVLASNNPDGRPVMLTTLLTPMSSASEDQ